MPVSEPCIVVRLDESELHVCVGIPNAIFLLAQARPRMIQHLSSYYVASPFSAHILSMVLRTLAIRLSGDETTR